jgi:hypothetical protein
MLLPYDSEWNNFENDDNFTFRHLFLFNHHNQLWFEPYKKSQKQTKENDKKCFLAYFSFDIIF